jgi:hypothetical protein
MADDEVDAGAPPAAPPEVVLVGESGFRPVHPEVGVPITYYWSETNVGGKHPDVYHARVKFEGPDGTIDDVSVECTPLATNEAASRETTLSAPAQEGIEYSIELWVDVDHYEDNNYGEGRNYAYHTFNVDG